MDNLDKINFSLCLWQILVDIYDRLCNADVFFRTQPHGELFLSKYGLYPEGKNDDNISSELEALLWLLNLSDGKHTFSKIIKLSGCEEGVMKEAAVMC